ncbi:nitric-oxide reductase large subunit [Polyangium spumosum]|uniref:Nitric-oxide reductase large subunit n=1 Tax=Polyangium spumosum TaxID=889282 RepID=A0A6N7PSD8_9BACT|nr:nitric-oxide reductase large subunit [Polyangium spumosum]MRG93155.1 nitric-oxide reductase large subunit [Polyangium spumosum]
MQPTARPEKKSPFRGLWLTLATVILASFAVLGYYGWQIHQKAPPLPARVVADDGAVLYTQSDIQDGQNVWQSMGGQEVGSIWGHGGYQAPDWSADWLHRESTHLADSIARAEHGAAFDTLDPVKRAGVQAMVQAELRTNTYDPATGDLRISSRRAAAIKATASHYDGLFGADTSLASLREAYAIPTNSVPDVERRRMMNAFFFWASWSCVTERVGEPVTYTNNWPPDELVGNRVTAPIVIWSIVSFVLLLAGIGGMVWYFAAKQHEEEPPPSLLPGRDPLLQLQATPSMKATVKYFWVAAALFILQVGLGAVTAHYTVEGTGFYGIPLAEILPYAVTRTWHIQLAIFWIATTWLATGLFMAPAVGGDEPRYQRAGVNFLFVCLLIIVVGSLGGTWYSTRQRMGLEASFWFGHQGLEYTDIGRFWQIFLFVGLVLWLVLMVRALMPALRRKDDQRPLVGLFLLSSLGIAMFYAAGLMWGRHSHLSMVEYWRWWVVHLWVEGFFEVFATVIIAFLFVRLGLARPRAASRAVLFSTIIFLSGGVIGTFHHLYFSGTPTAVLALGAVFSALEVVPLSLIGFEAYSNLRLVHLRPWVQSYKWPIYFFVAVAFWNLVGAGLFGFMINPPIALYYMQGLNTTPVHGHTALFGVYGMLGIGLMLFCLRGLFARFAWKTGVIAFAFWAINIGLGLMAIVSLLPVGVMQAIASVEHGMWYARSAEFLQTPVMEKLRWSRVLGDTIFATGILALGYFLLGLVTGWSLVKQEAPKEGTSTPPPPLDDAPPMSLPPNTLRGAS